MLGSLIVSALPYGIISLVSAGLKMEMTPAQVHMILHMLFMLAMSTVGASGAHGAVITGILSEHQADDRDRDVQTNDYSEFTSCHGGGSKHGKECVDDDADRLTHSETRSAD